MVGTIIKIGSIVGIWFCTLMSFKVVEIFCRKWTKQNQPNILIKQGKFWLGWLWKLDTKKDMIPTDFTKSVYLWGVSKDVPDYEQEVKKAFKPTFGKSQDRWNDLPFEFYPKKKTSKKVKEFFKK